VVKRNDELDVALRRAAQHGMAYRLEKTIEKKDEPVIEIYRRAGGL